MNAKHKKAKVIKSKIKKANLSFPVIGVIKESWGKVKGCKGTIFLAWVVLMLLNFIVNVVQVGVDTVIINMGYTTKVVEETRTYYIGSEDYYTDGHSIKLRDKVVVLSVTGLLISNIIKLLILFFIVPISVGFAMLGIKRASKQSLSVGSLFHYYSKMFSLVAAYIICFLLVSLGFFCLFLPGIYLMIALIFVLPLIAEKNMGLFLAIKTSVITVTKCWFRVFGVFGLLWLIGIPTFFILGFAVGFMIPGSVLFLILASLALIVGLISLVWVMPLTIISYGVVYRELFGVKVLKRKEENLNKLSHIFK